MFDGHIQHFLISQLNVYADSNQGFLASSIIKLVNVTT